MACPQQSAVYTLDALSAKHHLGSGARAPSSAAARAPSAAAATKAAAGSGGGGGEDGGGHVLRVLRDRLAAAVRLGDRVTVPLRILVGERAMALETKVGRCACGLPGVLKKGRG